MLIGIYTKTPPANPGGVFVQLYNAAIAGDAPATIN